MATYSKLPSRRWRVQIRKSDTYRAQTFDLKRTKPQTLLFALRDYIDRRQAEGAGGVTIAQDLSYLATALDWGRHTKRLDVDPEVARDARRSLKHRKLDTRSQSRERLPTEAELDSPYELWDKNPRQLIPMSNIVQFALESAMRLGEICRIQIEDVDFDNKTVLIRTRKDPKRKASNDQVVPLVGNAIAMIQKQIEQRQKGEIYPYNSHSVSAAFTRACELFLLRVVYGLTEEDNSLTLRPKSYAPADQAKLKKAIPLWKRWWVHCIYKA